MNRYTIYCTEEQVKKALKLGAPINEAMSRYNSRLVYERITQGKETRGEYNKKGIAILGKRTYKIPTAEQMIGWLEETYDLHINIDYRRDYANDADGNIVDEWYYYCFFLSIADKCFYGEDTLDEYSSRKEATLAAIDATLEYLTNNKK